MPLVDFARLFLEADNLRNNAKVDQAIRAYREIAELATEADELPIKARALHLAGVAAKENVTEEGTYYRDAQVFFNQTRQLYQALDLKEDLGALYRDLALIADYAGNSAVAIDNFQKSIATLEVLGANGQLGITYDKLGLHHYRQGDYPAAVQAMEKGLRLLEEEPSAGFFHATALYDLARVKYRLGQLDVARELSEQSLSWFEADHGNRQYLRRIAQINGLLSVIYFHLEEKKLARHAAERYQALCRTFDPAAAKVLEKDLQELVS